MEELITYLSKKYTIPNQYEEFISVVDLWKQWFKGETDFHTYQIQNSNNQTSTMKRSKMYMAKTVCEDWANFLLNEKTYIKVDDEDTQNYLFGDVVNQEMGVFGDIGFWDKANKFIEKVYAFGTGAVILTLDNTKIINNQISTTDIGMKFIKNPSRIIPISYDDDEIDECLFISYKQVDKKTLYNVMCHQKENQGYRITNLSFIKENGKIIETEFQGVKSYYTPCKTFFILKPNLENNIMDDIPMGISIYSNAINALKTIDISYTNFDLDFILGRKKVFMAEDMVQITVDGNGNNFINKNETLETTMYTFIPKSLNDEKSFFQEFNPSIRVDENLKGIQTGLNLLSLKCRLGNNFYNFDFDSRRVYQNTTSTKANNENLYRNITRQRINITKFLNELVLNYLKLVKHYKQDVKDDVKISIQYDDSYFTDLETEKSRFIEEINAGIRKPFEYRMKFFGEDETEAKEKTVEVFE